MTEYMTIYLGELSQFQSICRTVINIHVVHRMWVGGGGGGEYFSYLQQCRFNHRQTENGGSPTVVGANTFIKMTFISINKSVWLSSTKLN